MIGHNSMAQNIFRAHQERGYTKIRNEFLQDPRISDETRGLIARLLSRPVDWYFNVKEIIASGPSGRDKVYRMIKEAEEYGYIAPDSPRRENGTFRARSYLVTDDPSILIDRVAKEIVEIQSKKATSPVLEERKFDAIRKDSMSSTSGNSGNGPLPHTENTELDKNLHPLPAIQEIDIYPLPEKPYPAKPYPVFQDAYKGYIVVQKNEDTNIVQHEVGQHNLILEEKDICKEKSEAGYSKDFEEWWKIYPRREGKGKAATSWKELSKSKKLKAMDALRKQLAILSAKADDKRGNFCPLPATWLNQSRFDDEPKIYHQSNPANDGYRTRGL